MKISKISKISIGFFLFCFSFCFSNVSLPNVFGDNMVLQRTSEVKIWGWSNPSEEVTITTSWNQAIYKTKANNQAKWEVSITTPKEGGPYDIDIVANNSLQLKNILIGEVWLCSGQSNMEMTPSWGITNSDFEIKNATNSTIRFFNVPKISALAEQNDLKANWEICSPETMKNCSAVAYFFAQKMQEKLKDVPIGLMIAAWGGTPAEIWIPENEISQNFELLEASNKIKTEPYGPKEPGRAYNAMIHPVVGFNIAGVIWYQGESNVGSNVYDKTFATLIKTWRKLWNKNMPFYYAQIAPYNYGKDNFSGVIIRDAQRLVLQAVENTAMVITSDISTTDDIHPKDKKTVGVRLANLALHKIYKINESNPCSPEFQSIEIIKEKIKVSFLNNEGLYFKNKKNTQFEIADSDGIFYTANATLSNNEVFLQSKKVKSPKKIRFAWSNSSQSELFNKYNLPASSFLTN